MSRPYNKLHYDLSVFGICNRKTLKKNRFIWNLLKFALFLMPFYGHTFVVVAPDNDPFRRLRTSGGCRVQLNCRSNQMSACFNVFFPTRRVVRISHDSAQNKIGKNFGCIMMWVQPLQRKIRTWFVTNIVRAGKLKFILFVEFGFEFQQLLQENWIEFVHIRNDFIAFLLLLAGQRISFTDENN